ncbi:MAG: hypothetical protein IKE64_13390 [Thermoguttaceae bacterium]|nr:hypothetical protein [Thermoguttaceae bacterium]
MNQSQKTRRMAMAVLLLLAALVPLAANRLFCDEPTYGEAFLQALYADWDKQEGRLHRDCGHPMALNNLVFRAERLYENLTADGAIDEQGAQALRQAIDQARSVNTLPNESDLWTPNGPAKQMRLGVYRKLRLAIRRAIFSSEPLAGRQIVFLKGNRYGFQLLQDYLSYYMRFSNIHGGGLYILKNPGMSFETIDLTKDFPMGQFATPNLSSDAKTLYFSFADFSKVMDPNAPRLDAVDTLQAGDPGLPDTDTQLGRFLKEPEGKFHLFKMNLSDGSYQQLTEGVWDDFSGAPLPDGGVVFCSTRRGSFARCNGSHEPIFTATLHRLDPDGSIKTLSWHETNEWTPQVMNDGRIIYTRWDYVDRAASRYQGLWLTNPDGTGAVSLFGNYTEDVCVAIQPRVIPGSNKVMFLGAAHHLGVGGTIAVLDPSRVTYDPQTGFDDLGAIEVFTPEVPFPETPQIDDLGPNCVPTHYYYSPFPLSEDSCLTAYSHDPMGGYLPTHGALTHETVMHGRTGVYYRDKIGNLELLYEDPQFECRDPLLIAETPPAPVIAPQSVDSGEENAVGTFSLSNVYESLRPMPEDRPIKELRIYQLLPKYPTHTGHNPKIGHDFAGSARMLLGTVPVEKDGSAHFTAPARKPLYFQAVDESGRAVQTMHSEVYLQPGENRGCVGCHEQAQTTADNVQKNRIAFLRPASQITPGPAGTLPFNYVQLIQPILDRSCAGCHDGSENSHVPALTNDPSGSFSVSYQNLRPYLRWYEWAESSIRRTCTFPGESGADISRLSGILDDENHRGIDLSDTDRRNIYLWLDANVPFYGSYDPAEQAKQREGKQIDLPPLQ